MVCNRGTLECPCFSLMKRVGWYKDLMGGCMKLRVYGKIVRFWFMVAAVLVLFTASKAVYAADARLTIWQSRDQFVSVISQDSAKDVTSEVNNHPLEMSLDRLTSILSSISVRLAPGENPGPLFTAAALQVLVPHLQQGLRQAAPGEDVVFAVFGLHDALYGFAKSPRVTTGRIFFKAGKLNLIVGLVQKEVNDREDRRLSPFTPGSRQNASAGEWTLLTDTPLVRRDWMVFGDEFEAPLVPSAVVERKTTPVQVIPIQPAKRHEDARTPAERLVILNELKEKGLITEDEYRAKRLEILSGI